MLNVLSKRLSKLVKRFARGQAGNMAAITAMSAVPLMLAGGAAVDYGNWVSVQARLQAAVDAAALAAARDINLTDSELERVAKDYFISNFGAPKNSGTPEVTLSIDNSKVRVDAKVSVDNYLLKVVGEDQQIISTYAEVTMQAQNLEVALVFDNTGSMASQSRLSTLKVASHDFVEILFDGQQTARSLKVGVVPFSQFVNVGPDKVGAKWLDTSDVVGEGNPLGEMNFMAGSGGPQTNWAAWLDVIARRPQLAWPGCVESRKPELSVRDVFTAGNKDHLFVPAFAPDEPGKVSENQACFDDNGDRTNCGNADKWVYYNNYMDDSLSDAPMNVSGDIARLTYLQEHARKYRRGRVNTKDRGNVRGPDKGCNIQPIQPLTNLKAPVLSTIDAMVADGYTHVAEGVAWGLRVLSNDEPFTEGAPYGEDIKKAMVLLTDGENTFEARQKNHNLSTYTAYGFLRQARLGSSEYHVAVSKQDELMVDACKEVKANGVEVYAFAYNVASAAQRSRIEGCASTDPTGKRRFYFEPTSNLDLVENFQLVANDLRSLYLSK
jgi:Flp pilus assembly protein TadG